MSEAAPNTQAAPSPVPANAAPAGTAANDNDTPRVQGAPANDNGSPPTGEQRADLKQAQSAGELTAAQFRALADGGKVKLKVYGREREVDAAEALRLLQINAAGDDALRTAAEERKRDAEVREDTKRRVQQLGQSLRNDTLGTLRKLGLEEALYSQLEAELKYQQMPEEQRAKHEIETERQQIARERAEWKAEQERHQQEAQGRREQQQAQEDARRINQEWAQALDGAGFGPSEKQRKLALRHMMNRAQAFIDNGMEMPPAQDLAMDAREHFRELAREYTGGLDPRRAEEELGPEFLRELRKADVARIKETQARSPAGQFQNGTTARVESPMSSKQAANGKQVKYTGGLAGWMAARDAKLNGRK
jgi:hypothetical protein